MNLKDLIIIATSLIVVALIIAFLGGPEKILQDVLTISPVVIIGIMILFIVDLLLRVVRWKSLLLSYNRDIPIKSLIAPMISSVFLNVFTPARAGEGVRLYVLKENYDVSLSEGVSIIVVEQVLNMISLLMVAIASLILILIQGGVASTSALQLMPIILFTFQGVLLALVFLAWVEPDQLEFLFNKLPSSVAIRGRRIMRTFKFGIRSLRSRLELVGIVFGASSLIWLIESFIIYMLAIDVIHPEIEISVAMLASTIGNLTFIFPLLPGSLGEYELAVGLILSLSEHYSGHGAVLVAGIDRTIKSIILVIIGGYFSYNLGVREITQKLSALRETSSEEKAEEKHSFN